MPPIRRCFSKTPKRPSIYTLFPPPEASESSPAPSNPPPAPAPVPALNPVVVPQPHPRPRQARNPTPSIPNPRALAICHTINFWLSTKTPIPLQIFFTKKPPSPPHHPPLARPLSPESFHVLQTLIRATASTRCWEFAAAQFHCPACIEDVKRRRERERDGNASTSRKLEGLREVGLRGVEKCKGRGKGRGCGKRRLKRVCAHETSVHGFFEQLGDLGGLFGYVVLTAGITTTGNGGDGDEVDVDVDMDVQEESAYRMLRRYVGDGKVRRGKWWLFEDMPKVPRRFEGEICPCRGPMI